MSGNLFILTAFQSIANPKQAHLQHTINLHLISSRMVKYVVVWSRQVEPARHNNIQMQFSKNSQEGFDFIAKMDKLKRQIENASEYLDLEKCSSKLSKIQEKVSAITEKKKRKEIRELLDDAQKLIALKTKKFKRRIIDQIAQGTRDAQGNSKDKTLKHYRSMENFELAKAAPQKARAKNDEDDSWQNITEVHQPRNLTLRLEKRVEQLQDEITNYRKKISKIEEAKTTANLTQLCYRFGEQQGLFQQQLSFKIREKGLQIDQLRQKLRRSEQKNQQLKNRLLNQQKRQEDYIQNLKTHITNMAGELESAGRENKKLQEELNKIYYVCDGYKLEVKKLMQELQQLHREKKRNQQNELLKMKDHGLKRELETLEMQEKYMRDMECLLQNEKEEKNVQLEKAEQLQRRNASLEHQHSEMLAENERLEEMLDLKAEEIAELKKEMLRCLDHKNKCENQLMNNQAIILKLQAELQSHRQKKAQDLQKKAENLRQIKSLLELK